MSSEESNRPELFIDNERFDWDKDVITGAELRELGSLPDDVEIFWKVPGQPDVPVENERVINLTEHPGPDRFSTQSVGSQAGA
ncbi:hypothetical protein EUZ85_17450 [Hahella sp. KA22]|uniref:multiubiquitin domain-containing protein n=1 Tax=Hahella sp. KA22 TaxID=1628392 RepID=UPI000FDEAB82|nr:multiubiquitin domain-containing protein [Hahella sp. KA22]AZZ92410.1 hypothetical protein ENC22_14875 [Hahella sp. KA22]QAY55785.1 hypothetical protein EUZ85_17450 [Hahella sp. KA22]